MLHLCFSAFVLTEQRLQEKEKLLQELNGQYDELGKEVGAGDTDEVTFDTTFSRRHLQLMRCADFFRLRCPLSER